LIQAALGILEVGSAEVAERLLDHLHTGAGHLGDGEMSTPAINASLIQRWRKS
jgi:hypothetical protein